MYFLALKAAVAMETNEQKPRLREVVDAEDFAFRLRNEYITAPAGINELSTLVIVDLG